MHERLTVRACRLRAADLHAGKVLGGRLCGGRPQAALLPRPCIRPCTPAVASRKCLPARLFLKILPHRIVQGRGWTKSCKLLGHGSFLRLGQGLLGIGRVQIQADLHTAHVAVIGG